MNNVELSLVWRIVCNGRAREVDRVLVAILGGIAESSKVTRAARAARISDRHARKLIKVWSDFLGSPLVITHEGKGTTLSPLGEGFYGRLAESNRASPPSSRDGQPTSRAASTRREELNTNRS
jgi:molybdenum-dependent DNA-binding transcriptional regulator ModE